MVTPQFSNQETINGNHIDDLVSTTHFAWELELQGGWQEHRDIIFCMGTEWELYIYIHCCKGTTRSYTRLGGSYGGVNLSFFCTGAKHFYIYSLHFVGAAEGYTFLSWATGSYTLLYSCTRNYTPLIWIYRSLNTWFESHYCFDLYRDREIKTSAWVWRGTIDYCMGATGSRSFYMGAKHICRGATMSYTRLCGGYRE